MKPTLVKYFAYGSNMLIERLKARVSSASDPKAYALRGHKLRFHKKSTDCSGKCGIVKTDTKSDVVHGVLFNVEEGQLGSLDKAEGAGYGYRRGTMMFQIGDAAQEVVVYLVEPGYVDEALVPYRWYYELVMAGAIQQKLPPDYIAGLRAIPYTEDPIPDRPEKRDAEAALEAWEKSESSIAGGALSAQ